MAVAQPRPDRVYGRDRIVERAEMILERDQPLDQQLVARPEDGRKELDGVPEALRIDAQRVQGREVGPWECPARRTARSRMPARCSTPPGPAPAGRVGRPAPPRPPMPSRRRQSAARAAAGARASRARARAPRPRRSARDPRPGSGARRPPVGHRVARATRRRGASTRTSRSRTLPRASARSDRLLRSDRVSRGP